jgi:hypothetical protein
MFILTLSWFCTKLMLSLITYISFFLLTYSQFSSWTATLSPCATPCHLFFTISFITLPSFLSLLILSLLPLHFTLSSQSSLSPLFTSLFLLLVLVCLFSFLSFFLFYFSLSSLDHVLLSKLLPLSD